MSASARPLTMPISAEDIMGHVAVHLGIVSFRGDTMLERACGTDMRGNDRTVVINHP